MKKGNIMEFFDDINVAYNNCGMHDSLSIMLDELILDTINEFEERLVTDVESFKADVNGYEADLMTLDYFTEYVWDVAEQKLAEMQKE